MNKILGIGTLLMMGAAFLIGLAVIWMESASNGIIYGITLLVSVPLIIYAYCAKCPARENGCAHYFPGKLTKLLPRRSQGAYKTLDYLVMILPVLFLIAFPQIWLIDAGYLLFTFWILIFSALIIIRSKICIVCTNNYCILCKNCSVLEQ